MGISGVRKWRCGRYLFADCATLAFLVPEDLSPTSGHDALCYHAHAVRNYGAGARDDLTGTGSAQLY